MDTNLELYSCGIEGHRKRARCKRLLSTHKGRVDTRLGSGKNSRTNKNNIFDEPIPNDPIPVLQPTPWRPSNVTTKDKQNIKQKITDFREWLLSYVPPKPKMVDKVHEYFKNKIKKIMKREIVCSNQHRPNLL